MLQGTVFVLFLLLSELCLGTQDIEALNYSPLKKIGEGAYGTVFECINSQGAIVALKKMRLFHGLDLYCASLREICLLRALNRSSIKHHVQIKDLKFAKDNVYCEMELLAKPLPKKIWPTDSKTVNQLVAALHEIHQSNIVHRDIKPPNIRVHVDGTIKFVDFGLGKLITNKSFDKERLHTRSVATLWYRSPELLLGCKTYDPFALDLWSLGCVIVELLNGQPLFPGCSEIEMVSKIFSCLGTPTKKGAGSELYLLPLFNSKFSNGSSSRLQRDIPMDTADKIWCQVHALLSLNPSERRLVPAEELSDFPKINFQYENFSRSRVSKSLSQRISRLLGHKESELISQKDKIILLDKLADLCSKLKLPLRCWYLAGFLIEGLVSDTTFPIDRSNLVLVGTSALIIAAKWTEVSVPVSDNFAKHSSESAAAIKDMVFKIIEHRGSLDRIMACPQPLFVHEAEEIISMILLMVGPLDIWQSAVNIQSIFILADEVIKNKPALFNPNPELKAIIKALKKFYSLEKTMDLYLRVDPKIGLKAFLDEVD